MTFHPVLHDPVESLRFGRVLPVEIAPASGPGACRYCDALVRPAASRAHFSVPQAAAQAVLRRIERGVSVDAVVFGGPGEPLRYRGLGSLLRKLRASAHVSSILLTNGALLADRDVRRDAREADTVVAWVPGLRDSSPGAGPAPRRADAWERHVEGIASLRREAHGRILLEVPVRAGRNDGEESRAAWRRAAERIRPERVFVIPDPEAEEEAPEVLEEVRLAIHPHAGAYLPDGTSVDVRCWAGQAP